LSIIFTYQAKILVNLTPFNYRLSFIMRTTCINDMSCLAFKFRYLSADFNLFLSSKAIIILHLHPKSFYTVTSMGLNLPTITPL